jgi:hypothetical protein
MRPYTTTLGGAFLHAIHPGPPTHAGDQWFHADLAQLGEDELRCEERCLQLRLLLTDRHDRGYWPSVWIEDRITRIAAELRRRGGPRR